jgi:predicted Zn-dependent protease
VVVAVAWTVGAFQLYEAAEHGGHLVYNYAGGVGMRSGDPADVGRLLLAGLYGEAQVDRREGRSADAARLIDEMVQRYPDNVDVQLLGAESLVTDREDGRAALDRLASLSLPDDARTQLRVQTMRFDAYMQLEMPDSARAALDAVPERYRGSRMVTERLGRLGG